MRRASRIDESLLVKACRLDNQNLAFEMSHGMAVVEGEGGEFLLIGDRFVQADAADLMTEFVHHGDLAGGPLDDFEWIRGGKQTRQTVGHAESSRVVGNGSILQTRDVFCIGR